MASTEVRRRPWRAGRAAPGRSGARTAATRGRRARARRPRHQRRRSPRQPKDCQAVGAACGHTGVAASLLTLAVAGEACVQLEQPVLTLTLQDPALRCAALVSRPAASATA
ncbi:hypothetical protein G6F62_014404 [Rhizopus arrhizus]|nr:hypothetical protein G6F62_014404 [Rhizopus arrhizus]